MDVEVIRTNLEDILMLLQKYFIECLVSVNNEQWDLLIKANINNNLNMNTELIQFRTEELYEQFC